MLLQVAVVHFHCCIVFHWMNISHLKNILSTLNGNFGLCLAFGYKATMSFLLSIYFVNINIDFWGYVFMSVIDTG